jgi:hypothetical protein
MPDQALLLALDHAHARARAEAQPQAITAYASPPRLMVTSVAARVESTRIYLVHPWGTTAPEPGGELKLIITPEGGAYTPDLWEWHLRGYRG